MSGIRNNNGFPLGHAFCQSNVVPASSSSCPANVLRNDPRGTKKEQEVQGSAQHLLPGSGLSANINGVLLSQQYESDTFQQNQHQQQQSYGYCQQQRFPLPVQQDSYGSSQPIDSFQRPQMQYADQMQGEGIPSLYFTGSASSPRLSGTCGSVSGIPDPHGGHAALGPAQNAYQQQHGVLHHQVPFDPWSVQQRWQQQSSTAMEQAMYQFQNQSGPLLQRMLEAQQQQLDQLQSRMQPPDQAFSSYPHGNDSSSTTQTPAGLLQGTGAPAFVQPGSQDSSVAEAVPAPSVCHASEHTHASAVPFEYDAPRGYSETFQPAGLSTHQSQLSASLLGGASRPDAFAIAAETSPSLFASSQQPTPSASETNPRTARRPAITRGQSIARTHSNKFHLPSKAMNFNQTASIFSHGTSSAAASSPLSELRTGNTSRGKDASSATAAEKAYVTAIRVHLCEGRELPIKVRVHHRDPPVVFLFKYECI